MLHFVYVRDKYEREPLGRVFLVFFVSFLTVIPAALFEGLLLADEQKTWLAVAGATFLVIGLGEELVKYVSLWLLAVKHSSFNEVYDGILYAVAASLGFATVENLAYVFFAGDEGFSVALLRAFLSIPGHALWGVMMGYYVGRAKFASSKARVPLILTGITMAVFWHGLYDFFAFGIDLASPGVAPWFVVGLIAVLVINWWIGLRMIRHAQELSFFKRPNPLVNPVLAFNRRLNFCHQCGCQLPVPVKRCPKCGYELPGSCSG